MTQPPHPGDAPRPVPFTRVIELAPPNFQIPAFIGPLALIGGAIWYFIDPSRQAVGLLSISALVTVVAAILLWRVRVKLANGSVVLATVVSIDDNQKLGYAGIRNVTYRYTIAGNEFEKSHAFNARDKKAAASFEPGNSIWVLYPQGAPDSAIPWI